MTITIVYKWGGGEGVRANTIAVCTLVKGTCSKKDNFS